MADEPNAAGSGADNAGTADTAGSGTADNAGSTASGTATGNAGGDAVDTASDKAGGKAGGSAGGKAGSSGGGSDADSADRAETGTDSESIEDLPSWAQKRIKALTKENGDNRLKAKTASDKATAVATENAQKLQGFLDGFAKVLGLTVDEDDQPKTLDAAMAKLSKSEEAIQQAAGSHRQLEVRLAVWETAGGLGANTTELMDSAAFLGKINGLDPAAKGFRDTLAKLIGEQIESNPVRFKAVQPKPLKQSGGEFTGGPGGRPNDNMSIEDHLRLIDPVARNR